MHTHKGYRGEHVSDLVSLDEARLAVSYKGEFDTLAVGRKIRIVNWQMGGIYGKLVSHVSDVLTLTTVGDTFLASGSRDTTIKVWHWSSGRLVKNLTGHTQAVNDLLTLHNSTMLVSCADDKFIKMWNTSNGNLLKTLLGHSHGDYHVGKIDVSRIVMSHNGFLVSSFADNIKVWNLTQGKTIRYLNFNSEKVRSLQSLNKELIASGMGREIFIWEVNSGKQVKTLLGHVDGVRALVLLENGHLASASSDHTIRIWDLRDRNDVHGSLFLTLSIAHDNGILCLTLLANGNLASGSQDGSFKIWYFQESKIESSNFL
jgi:WD40 repeat protein